MAKTNEKRHVHGHAAVQALYDSALVAIAGCGLGRLEEAVAAIEAAADENDRLGDIVNKAEQQYCTGTNDNHEIQIATEDRPMSVTFFPSDNMRYCDANGLTGKTVYDCQCKDFPEMFPADGPPCRNCGGKGQVEFPYYPFEANLANGNARAMMELLGMPVDYSGTCEPQVILDGIAFVRSLNACGHTPGVTPTTTEGGQGSLRVIHCGRDEEQIERYLKAFEEIALEAARRKVPVVWG